jgi:hypothetical protein
MPELKERFDQIMAGRAFGIPGSNAVPPAEAGSGSSAPA